MIVRCRLSVVGSASIPIPALDKRTCWPNTIDMADSEISPRMLDQNMTDDVPGGIPCGKFIQPYWFRPRRPVSVTENFRLDRAHLDAGAD
jgi:hypothetical protein